MFPKGGNFNLPFPTSTLPLLSCFSFVVVKFWSVLQPMVNCAGAEGFPEDTELTEVNGKIQANETQQDLNKMMEQLQAGSLDDSDLEVLAKSMRKAINSLSKRPKEQ